MDEFCIADRICAEDWRPDDEEIDALSAEALRSRVRCLERRLARRREPAASVPGILDAIDAAVVVLGPGQRVLEANGKIRSWLAGEEIIGRSFSDVPTGAACRNRLISRVSDCLNGKPFELEIRAEMPGGRRWLHISGRPLGGNESGPEKAALTLWDVTRHRRLSKRDGITGRVLRRLNRSGEVSGMIRDILREIKSGFDMEAAALRLRKGEDFPYHESEGFSEDFIREESFLCRRDGDGEILRDPDGRAMLACMCGSVISGHFDSQREWFTRGGSFWSRDLCGVVSEIAGTPLAEATRQRCHLEGYRTAALVPIKTGDAIIGLLQLADPHPNKLSEADIAFLEQLGHSIGVAVARVADEERLREKEADLQRAQSVAHWGSWRFDLDTRLVQASPEARRIYGLDKETLTIPEVQQLPLPAFRPVLNGALAQLVKEGAPYDATFQIRRPADGKVLDIHSVAEYDAERNVVVGVIRDVTDRQRLENQLRQAQKLEGIGQLAGGVAHDFNNMLSPIIGYAEMLKDDLSPDDPRTEDVDEILRAAVRSRNLVRKLLAFARKQALEMKPIRLNRIVREMEPMLRRTIREDVVLSSFLDADPDTIRGDESQIEQVLLNLAVNARDAMPDGGRLTIETRAVALDETYCSQRAGAAPGAYLMLSVSDTGNGMDAELQARVFEPFFTTKPTGQGTGMGLATVYGIVKQHRGNIWVYSEPGQGTTFKVYLPQMACVGEIPCLPETEAPAGEEETVLLVEDEASVRQMVRHALERRGYLVLEMESPAACLDFLEGYNAPIDLLLTDVVMPGMNGRELYRRIAETRPNLPVLFMSGYTENVISRQGVLEPGVALLQKPFSVKELARKVREVLEEAK
jgi:PAS domain S-box-containing protein